VTTEDAPLLAQVAAWALTTWPCKQPRATARGCLHP